MEAPSVVLMSSEDIRELSEANREGRPYLVYMQDGTPVQICPWVPDNTD
ncbi:hypothetical protein [Streptomyces misionensis]